MGYVIGNFRGHTLWMTNDKTYKNSSTDDMYVNSHDYSVWYKGRQVGYMTHDKSRIDPFNERVYKDLKALKLTMPEPAARVRENKKVKEAPAAELIPTSSLLDAENEVEEMLKSVKDYCGAKVLDDEVFAELAKELEVLMG